MKNVEKDNDGAHLAKLKAFLERSRLEWTETRKGNTTVMAIRPVKKEGEDEGEANRSAGEQADGAGER